VRSIHVHSAAAIEKAVFDIARERAVAPGALIPGRHHVGMAAKRDVRSGAADPGIKVVDIGRAGFAKGDAMHFEAGGAENFFDNAQCARIGRGYRRAAQEIAGNGEGVGHRFSGFNRATTR